MFRLIDIVDVMCGDYEHTPTWKEMNLSARTVLSVGHEYEGVPVLLMERDGVAVDFQILQVQNGKLHIYLNPLQEPVNRAMLDELRQVLHTATLVEKDAVYAVVEAQYVAEEIRADMVALEIPDAVLENSPELQEKYGAIFQHAKARGLTPIVGVPYTEEFMSQMLPQGFKILDYIYVL